MSVPAVCKFRITWRTERTEIWHKTVSQLTEKHRGEGNAKNYGETAYVHWTYNVQNDTECELETREVQTHGRTRTRTYTIVLTEEEMQTRRGRGEMNETQTRLIVTYRRKLYQPTGTVVRY